MEIHGHTRHPVAIELVFFSGDLISISWGGWGGVQGGSDRGDLIGYTGQDFDMEFSWFLGGPGSWD